ncbi:MAG: hypothetical protein WC828_01905 [Thermoleophilia bacterium]|jgi:hypothetical protein
MSDSKKIAVIVSDRQDEGLRMALGLTLEGDEISVFNLGSPIEMNDGNEMNVEALGEFDCLLYSVNEKDAAFTQINMQDMPAKLLEFNDVLSY